VTDAPAPTVPPALPSRPPRSALVTALPVVAAVLVVAGILVLLAGRRDGGDCSGEVSEHLDPRSLQHVLPGSTPPSFSSAAPTSGPHQVGFVEGGPRDQPVPPAIQVGALEAGAVLVQHRPDLPAAERTSLRALATGRVIVAPNPQLDAPVVATAWQVSMRCRSFDLRSLRRFIARHGGATAGPDLGGSVPTTSGP
jgi:hypothetical protein